jgi:hemerythrin-like metal-binding protein
MADYIAWNPYYSVGETSIDTQHKQIIGMINELYAAVVAKKTDIDLKKIMDRLIQYTVTHFQHEEEMMRDSDYPALASHLLLHEKLKRRTMDLRNNLTLVTGRDLLVFLKDWWCNHIQDEDKKYSPYLGVLTH